MFFWAFGYFTGMLTSLLQQVRTGWGLLEHLFYPRLCLACQRRQAPGQANICVACRYRLPVTNFHTVVDNPMAERLWGRLPFEQAAAYLYFDRGGQVQQLIHQLKYRNRPDIGEELGRLYGQVLAQADSWQRPDLIIPVPLHPRKLHQRGYNQAAAFGRGLAEALGLRQMEHALRRTTYANSQTRKTRLERMANVTDAFALAASPAELSGKHLLLVDDVFTTGATLEACALPLLAVEGVRISMATIAIATQ